MMTDTMPSELFEPKGVDAGYLSFLVNEHRKIYLGTRSIIRLSYGRDKGKVQTCQGATYKLIRLLKNLYPAGLSIDGMVLWVEMNPDESYTRYMISMDQYES